MSERIPFVAIGTDALDGQPTVRSGALILCGRCTGTHTLTAGIGRETGQSARILLFYRCGFNTFVGAVDGQLWPGLRLAPVGGTE